MNYYLLKASVLDSEGKKKKENYVVKADSSITAEGTGVLNLAHKDLEEITDINKKTWVDVITSELGGNWYEVKIEWDNVDGKIIKESYLVQDQSTKQAEDVITSQQECEVVAVVKTNILDYFEQEFNKEEV